MPDTFAPLLAHIDRPKVVASIQRFRGGVYLSEGAIKSSDLSTDGRHISALDDSAWHIVISDANLIMGCIRLNIHGRKPSLSTFHLRRVAERMPEPHAGHYRVAMERTLLWAEELQLPIGEVGGWAVTEELRRGSAGMTLALSVFAISEILQNVAMAAATVRNSSNTILTRLGGFPLKFEGTDLPPVFDPAYGCEMQILGFHWKCSDRYTRMCESIRNHFQKSILDATPRNGSTETINK